MPNVSTATVKGRVYKDSARTVRRSTLNIGDCYKNKAGGRTYMHTGARTRPPSGSHTEIAVNGKVVHNADNFATLLRQNGKDVIAFQAIVVEGAVKAGEDGTVVSFQDKDVLFVGAADITLNLFR